MSPDSSSEVVAAFCFAVAFDFLVEVVVICSSEGKIPVASSSVREEYASFDDVAVVVAP